MIKYPVILKIIDLYKSGEVIKAEKTLFGMLGFESIVNTSDKRVYKQEKSEPVGNYTNIVEYESETKNTITYQIHNSLNKKEYETSTIAVTFGYRLSTALSNVANIVNRFDISDRVSKDTIVERIEALCIKEVTDVNPDIVHRIEKGYLLRTNPDNMEKRPLYIMSKDSKVRITLINSYMPNILLYNDDRFRVINYDRALHFGLVDLEKTEQFSPAQLDNIRRKFEINGDVYVQYSSPLLIAGSRKLQLDLVLELAEYFNKANLIKDVLG